MAEPTVEDFVRLHARMIDAGRTSAGLPALYDSDGDSAGGQFIRSESYRTATARLPEGMSDAVPNFYRSEPVETRIGLRTLLTSGSGSAGTLVPPDFRGLIEPGLVRPLTIRQLVTVLQTSENNAVEYVRESGRTAAAAPVAEATALTGTSGTKPEGGLTFAKVTVPVRTIAEWLPVTTRILQDAPNLRAYIDNFLTGDVALELEDQMLTGDGTGENFTGILNTAGVQTTAVGAAPAQVLDAIRTAKRLVFTNGRTAPNAVVMHPDDLAQADGLKDANNLYIGPGPYSAGVRALWGMQVVETDAIPAGTALVGAFDKAILFDRQAVSISVGTVNDQFVRNQVAVLAELRAAFAVVRPSAFCTVTGA